MDENLDVPGKVGSLVLNLQGKILKSDGELENDEKVAALFFNILQDASAVIAAVGKEDPFKRLSINCGQFVYVVTVANETIFVVKKDA